MMLPRHFRHARLGPSYGYFANSARMKMSLWTVPKLPAARATSS